MASGKVKSYHPEKGFGYITPDDGGADVWFDHSSFDNINLDHLEEGQTVEYKAANGVKGPVAESVQLS
ncbi:cold-shock protein [Streptomyces sp. McG3]|uniref:cold-shock protein n=1 Tax=Streptomyces sp. McG3 TaxID=2725483 RepID=UPI001BE9B3F2|nr:cold shock domain-containing protein [Streptomyces sp. McG3]MBT2898911.1 cold shock domain-containing protein [Streptomyces sp. McG3]